MAGLGRKVFNSGDILLASEVQGYLQDQAVMVFDDSATRATAIGTANFSEGMASYLKDTDQVEVYNGSAWNSVSNSGLVHIETADFSGAVSHSFGDDTNPIFSSTFDNYFIYIYNASVVTAAGNLSFRLRANLTDLTAANYDWQRLNVNGTAVSGERLNGQTSFRVGGISPSNPAQYIIEVSNPFASLNKPISAFGNNSVSGTGNQIHQIAGTIFNTSSYNGFTLFGANNISGTVSIYGYRK